MYHLYFGNEKGESGTLITFFPWDKQLTGRIGKGQVGVTSYAIPKHSIDFWKNRLRKFGVKFFTFVRFGKTYLSSQDPDGLEVELVERDEGPVNYWNFAGIEPEQAIKGFSGAALISAKLYKTAEMLECILGLTCVGEQEGFLRFKPESQIGHTIDIKLTPSVRGLMGAGTVHHIAWRSLLEEKGYHPTEVLDRNYFKSIYFHEAGGILFEIATDLPGFLIDEPVAKLGEKLMLPSWLESKRAELEDTLPTLKVRVLEGEPY